MSKEQYDALDLLITALREYEGTLNATVERAEAVICRLEALMDERARDGVAAKKDALKPDEHGKLVTARSRLKDWPAWNRS